VKQTNEIGMVIPTLEALNIAGKTITTDALLTQRALAAYLRDHAAHYVFTVKDNQPTLREEIRLFFADRGPPDFREPTTLAHGRIEQRTIWTTTHLNGYLNFPGVGQAFVIERHTVEKKTGKTSAETVYGVTSHTPDTATAAVVLAFNRGHWTVENGCHYPLDWNWDEDRCTIRTGHGPANITALRRFAIGAIRAKSRDTVAATIQRLARNVRLVFDYLRMTENSRRRAQPRPATVS
jgi:predicted transposase YbfD/YdcC